MAGPKLKEGIPAAARKVMHTLKDQAGKLSPELNRVREQMAELAAKIEHAKQPYSEFQRIKRSFDEIGASAKGKPVDEPAVTQELTRSVTSLQSLPLSEPLRGALERILSISYSGQPDRALRHYLPSRVGEWVSGMVQTVKGGNTALLKEAFGAGQAAIEVVGSHLSEWKHMLSGLASKAGTMLSKEGLGGILGALKNFFKGSKK